jgi:hypothetical protein
MLTVWHAIEPYFFTLGGVAFLVVIARGIVKGETASRYGGRVYRAESPISFWLLVVLNLLLSVALVGVGIASFYNVGR